MNQDELVRGMSLQGDPRYFRPLESLSPMNYSATLKLFFLNPSHE